MMVRSDVDFEASSWMSGPDTEDALHSDANNWYGGLVYYCGKDSRVFVPKRHQGLGWTLNFAHKESYGFMCALGGLVLWAVAGTHRCTDFVKSGDCLCPSH